MRAARPRRRRAVGLIVVVIAALATLAPAAAQSSGTSASSDTSSPTVRNIEASETASPRLVSLGAPDSPRDWVTLIGGATLLVTIAAWQGTLFRRRRREHERMLRRLESLSARRAA